MNKLGFKTNIFDINGIELKVGDIIKPINFTDINNLIIYNENNFYRVKKHKNNYYYNVLGNCKVKKIGSTNENLFNEIIKDLNQNI